MIKITKCNATDVTENEFERLYNEAFDYISEERKRMGDEQLRNALLNKLELFPFIKIEVDDYLVGVASYTDGFYNNKKYMLHRHPIYGCDINGSKAWWYSEEFQAKTKSYVLDNNYCGVITAFNPASPAAKAVISHFGSFNKYYNTPFILDDLSTTGISLNDNTLSVLVIDLNNDD